MVWSWMQGKKETLSWAYGASFPATSENLGQGTCKQGCVSALTLARALHPSMAACLRKLPDIQTRASPAQLPAAPLPHASCPPQALLLPVRPHHSCSQPLLDLLPSWAQQTHTESSFGTSSPPVPGSALLTFVSSLPGPSLSRPQ